MTETRHDTGYDRLLEDFGQRLKEAETRPAGRQRRRRHLAAGTVVLAGIAAGTLMLTGAGGGGRLDVVAQARAALAPAGHVVHLVTTSHMEMRGGSEAQIVGPEAEENAPRVTERWSTTQPTRWRVATSVPVVTAHGTSTRSVRSSYGGGTEESYIPSLNTLDVTTGVGKGPASRARLYGGPLDGDPVAGIRSMLVAGQLHDAGSGTIDGRAIRRLVGEELSRPQGLAHSPWPVEYDVDPTTYAPVRFTVEEVGMSFRGNTGTPTLIIDVNTYEALPLNETTAALLSIHPAGNPTVVHHDQEREELTAQSARHAPHDQRPTRSPQAAGG
jgi:hypothetical protein